MNSHGLVAALRALRHAAEFRVLLPEVGFNQFRRRQKFQNRGVARVQLLVADHAPALPRLLPPLRPPGCREEKSAGSR